MCYNSGMSLRAFVFAMIGATVLAWIAWGAILTGIDPYEAGLPGIVLFYVTLAVACAGTATLALSFIRLMLLKKKGIPSREVRTAFRHAMLFTIVLVASLVLSSKGAFHSWQVILLVVAVVFMEQFFARATRG